MTRAFVVLNPVAGSAKGDARSRIEAHLSGHGWDVHIHETRGDEDVSALVRQAAEEGVDLCVAAGGDGTVSAVANGLAGTDVPLGILPIGTGNVLAKELGIPENLEGALELLTGEHDIKVLDMIRVGDRRFVLNVSVGLGSLSMRDTTPEWKRRLGVLAYVLTGLRVLLGYQPHRFDVTVDGKRHRIRASEVMVANSAAVGSPGVRLGAGVRLDDGRLDLCVVRARNLLDYLRVAWDVLLGRQDKSRHVHCLPITDRVRIEVHGTLPVEADGDIIGETPVEATCEPAAVRVVVPKGRNER